MSPRPRPPLPPSPDELLPEQLVDPAGLAPLPTRPEECGWDVTPLDPAMPMRVIAAPSPDRPAKPLTAIMLVEGYNDSQEGPIRFPGTIAESNQGIDLRFQPWMTTIDWPAWVDQGIARFLPEVAHDDETDSACSVVDAPAPESTSIVSSGVLGAESADHQSAALVLTDDAGDATITGSWDIITDPNDDSPFALERDPQTRAYLEFIHEHPFGYLLGDAGTGKSYLAKRYAELSPDGLLLATTGIAAVNLGGTTINSTLRYYDTKSMQLEYEFGRLGAALGQLASAGVLRLIIDEISMMDGNQLDILSLAIGDLNESRAAKGLAPMGIWLTGDFAQLPPVGAGDKKTPKDQTPVIYAFQAKSWSQWAGHQIKLTQVRRQADQDFIRAIQQLRVGDKACVDYFRPMITKTEEEHFDGTSIMAKNDEVDRYNKVRILRIDTAEDHFTSTRTGELRDQPSEWKNIPEDLVLKPGCLVMILANRRYIGDDGPGEMIYANGDLATYLEKISSSHARVRLHRTNTIETVLSVVREKLKPGTPRTARRKEVTPPEYVLATIDYMPLRVAYASTVHKCVAPDTRVPVFGRGYVHISTIERGELTPYGPISGWDQTEQTAIRLTTRRGYSVVCSPDHRWMTKRGWICTQDLQTTDYIELNPGPAFPGVPRESSDYLSNTKAWILGALVGDGCYTDVDDGTVEFTCSHASFGEQFRQAMNREFGLDPHWRKDERGLHWTSQPFRRKLLGWGFEYVKAPLKSIPQIIWSQGPFGRGAFLAGLFDTDGHIGRNRVVLTTASDQLAKDVQELLLTLGILSKRSCYPGVKDSIYYQIFVGAESRDKFIQWVGLRHPDKQTKLKTDRPNRTLNPAFGYDLIAKIEYLGESIRMIDVEVPDPHVFAFGPFHGHNSQGLTMDNVQVLINSQFWMSAGLLYVGVSRARTPQGLRIVGTVDQFAARVRSNPMIKDWV